VAKTAQQVTRNTAYQWLAVQGIAVIIISLILALLVGTNSARSALLGGIVCVVPSLVFASRLFRHFGARSAQHIVKAFYKGEIIKLALTSILFILVLVYIPLNILAFLCGFLGAQWAFWLAPWLTDYLRKRL
jgi:ATP synthase protein I